MADHILESHLWLPRPRAEVFLFFADARNLATLTPRWLHVRLVSDPALSLAAGAVLDARIRWLGLPFRWRTLIREHDPPYRFVDVQLLGPYARWEHRHLFLEERGGTRVEDRVTYRLPLGPVGRAVHALCVRRQLHAIFAYRRRTLIEIFGGGGEGQAGGSAMPSASRRGRTRSVRRPIRARLLTIAACISRLKNFRYRP
jgi:ligand-binding SRPBCC domain-containing protein